MTSASEDRSVDNNDLGSFGENRRWKLGRRTLPVGPKNGSSRLEVLRDAPVTTVLVRRGLRPGGSTHARR